MAWRAMSAREVVCVSLAVDLPLITGAQTSTLSAKVSVVDAMGPRLPDMLADDMAVDSQMPMARRLVQGQAGDNLGVNSLVSEACLATVSHDTIRLKP